MTKATGQVEKEKNQEIHELKIKNVTKEFLKAERSLQETDNYDKDKINWLEDEFYDSWNRIKGHTKKLLGNGDEFEEGQLTKFFFLSHSKDSIKGKVQLIDNTQKRIPLIREVIKTVKNGDDTATIKKYFMFDERYDKRYDGYQRGCLAQDFWTYRVIEKGKEYYVLTQQQLPNQVCNLKGMIVEMDDWAEFSRSMKLKSLSRIFFMKEYEPSVKIISKEQCVQFTKNKGITEESWFSLLGYHATFNNFNRFPKDIEELKSAFVLSGKVDGYPLHLFVMGSPGTKKTDGHIETLSQRFSSDPVICEGGNSRIKALSPSFKEKPANIGYLAKQDRMGWVDEIGKMVEFELVKAHVAVNNVLGDLNFLLEHKNRMVGSGNDNDVNVQATAKFLMCTNAISGRPSIYGHVGLIDSTALSRMLIWVQDKQEQEFVLSDKGVEPLPKLPANPPNTLTSIYSKLNDIENRKKLLPLKMCSGNSNIVIDYIEREDFLTLYDSCNSFVCDIDDTEVERIVANTVLLAKEPMKSSVWKPRARHHTKLLIDGLCKQRCLFKDYDPSFTVTKEDYDKAESILIRMVKGWDTILSPEVAE